MSSLFAPNYLSRRPIEQALKIFARSLPPNSSILDIGCGHKPYAHLLAGHRYEGLDPDPASGADYHCSSTPIPLPDGTFDVVVCTQALQHIEQPMKTVSEIRRVLKSGGRLFLTVPFGIKMVATPMPAGKAPVHNFSSKDIPAWRPDYWRYTQFGLLLLLRDFGIDSIQPATGYIGTLCQLLNYAISSMHDGALTRPLFFTINTAGYTVDHLFQLLQSSRSDPLKNAYRNIYLSITSNYIVCARKP